MTRFRRLGRAEILAATALATGMAAAPAAAQDQPADPVQEQAQEEGEIVVTATLRETSLIEVPFSINAQSEADIQRSGAITIEDLSRNVAGLTIMARRFPLLRDAPLNESRVCQYENSANGTS